MGESCWYCSECGDGPNSTWHPCCASCGHPPCHACTYEGGGGRGSFGTVDDRWPDSKALEDADLPQSFSGQNEATAPVDSSSGGFDELGRGGKHEDREIGKVLGLEGQIATGEKNVGIGDEKFLGTVEFMLRNKTTRSDSRSPPASNLESEKDRPDNINALQSVQRFHQQDPNSNNGERGLEDHHMGKNVAIQPAQSSQEETQHTVTQVLIEGSFRDHQEANRLEHRPTQGDWVRTREMDPNRPEIEDAVRQLYLNREADFEVTEEEEHQPKDTREDADKELSRGCEQQEGRAMYVQDASTRGHVFMEGSDMSNFVTSHATISPSENSLYHQIPPISLTAVDAGSYDMTLSSYAAIRETLIEDDDVLSTYAESVFSNDSMGSSATGISAAGPYTEADILTATRELVEIFTKDPVTIQLYQRAFEDHRIGSERLKQNLHRLLKLYSQDLHREAQGELERLASQLVAVKSRYVTQCVMEKFFVKPPSTRHPTAEDNDSEEDDDVLAIDEDRFEDIQALRRFLVESNAFNLFKEHLLSFVRPKHLQGRASIEVGAAQEEAKNPVTSKALPEQPSEEKSKGSGSLGLSKVPSWELVDSGCEERVDSTILPPRYERLFHLTKTILRVFLVRLGFLEPALEPGLIRLRWQCACGDPLFGDVQEYRVGGASKLVDQMERLTGSKVTASSYQEGTVNERYILAPMIWARELFRYFRAFMKPADDDNRSIRHTDNESMVEPGSVTIEMPPVQDLLLLACMHQEEGGQVLCQDPIGAIGTDRELFRFIQKQLTGSRNAWWSLTQLKVVTGIHFTKFHLRLNDVEPRLHKPCCRPYACQCIPLFSNTEYDCAPAGPLEFGPPVLPQHMLHYFKHPERISEKEASILNQIPKRNCGELKADGRVPANGWGLYYEEDWDIGLIIVVIAATSIFVSLVFGICWTVMKADIQGAWGVSSYMITTGALVVALLSMIGRSRSE